MGWIDAPGVPATLRLVALPPSSTTGDPTAGVMRIRGRGVSGDASCCGGVTAGKDGGLCARIGSFAVVVASGLFVVLMLRGMNGPLIGASDIVRDNLRTLIRASDDIATHRSTSRYDSPSHLAEQGYFLHSSVVYGHVHIGKTGGTSLNGNLSVQYERVCGNKGASFSGIQANELVLSGKTVSRKDAYEPQYVPNKLPNGCNKVNLQTRIARSTLDEIGYEDCDYISKETWDHEDWEFWNKTFTKYFLGTGVQAMELHVVSRRPSQRLRNATPQHARPRAPSPLFVRFL